MGGESWEGVRRSVGEKAVATRGAFVIASSRRCASMTVGQGATSTKRLENYASEIPLLLLPTRVLREIISNKEPGSLEVTVG
jgi:hypothetical protein